MTGKVSGFGGTLDNISKQTQEYSCGLKEALMEVLLYRICLFLMRSYQVAPCEELSGKGYNFDAGNGQLLCDTNKPPKQRIFVKAESDALPDASLCGGDSGGPLVVCDGERIVVIGVAKGTYDETGKCRKNVSVTLYVDVQHYLPWIRSKIGQGKHFI